MKRNKKAEISLLIIFAFVAGLCAYKPVTDLLASSKQLVSRHVFSTSKYEDGNHEQLLARDESRGVFLQTVGLTTENGVPKPIISEFSDGQPQVPTSGDTIAATRPPPSGAPSSHVASAASSAHLPSQSGSRAASSVPPGSSAQGPSTGPPAGTPPAGSSGGPIPPSAGRSSSSPASHAGSSGSPPSVHQSPGSAPAAGHTSQPLSGSGVAPGASSNEQGGTTAPARSSGLPTPGSSVGPATSVHLGGGPPPSVNPSQGRSSLVASNAPGGTLPSSGPSPSGSLAPAGGSASSGSSVAPGSSVPPGSSARPGNSTPAGSSVPSRSLAHSGSSIPPRSSVVPGSLAPVSGGGSAPPPSASGQSPTSNRPGSVLPGATQGQTSAPPRGSLTAPTAAGLPSGSHASSGGPPPSRSLPPSSGSQASSAVSGVSTPPSVQRSGTSIPVGQSSGTHLRPPSGTASGSTVVPSATPGKSSSGSPSAPLPSGASSVGSGQSAPPPSRSGSSSGSGQSAFSPLSSTTSISSSVGSPSSPVSSRPASSPLPSGSSNGIVSPTISNVYVPESDLTGAHPTVHCTPPCRLIFPTNCVTSTTTLTFPPITTSLEVVWPTITEHGTTSNSTRWVSTTTPTTVTPPPMTTDCFHYFNMNITGTSVPSIISATPSIVPQPFVITDNLPSGIILPHGGVQTRTFTPAPWFPQKTSGPEPWGGWGGIEFSIGPPNICASGCGIPCIFFCWVDAPCLLDCWSPFKIPDPNFPDPAGPGGGETEPEPTHSEGENSASTKAASTTASTTSSTSSCMKTLTASEVVVSCFSMNNTALCQTASSIQITGCDVTATVTTEYASCPTMDPDDQGSCGSNSTLPGNSTITSTAMSSTMTTLKSSLLPSTLTTIGTSGVSGSNGNVSPMQTSSLASMTGGSTRYDFGLYTAVYTSGGSTNTYIKLGPLSSCWVDSSPHTNAALGPFPSVTGFVSTTAPYATTITAGIELPSGICGSGSAYKCSEFGVDGVNDMFCGSFDGSPGIACVQPNRSFETTCSASSGGAAVKLTLGLACAGGPACGPTATDAPFTDTATSTSSVGTTLPIAPTIGTGPAPTQAQSSWAIYQVILGSAGGKADTYVLPGPYSECVTDLHVGAAVQIVSGNPLGTDPVPSDPFASTLGTFGWTQGLCGNTDDYRCYPSNEESTSYECYDESKTNGGFGCTEASDIWSTTCGGSATVSMMLGCWGGPQCYVTTPASVSAPTTKVKPSPALTIPPTPAPKPYTWGLYGIEYVNLNDPQGISPQGIGPFGNLKDAQGIDPSGGFPRLIQPGPLHKCQSNEYAWPAVDLAGYTSGPLPRTPPASSFGSFAWPSGLCGVTIPYRCSPQDTQTETIDCFGPTAKAWDIHCTIASTSWEISCLNAQESVSASASLAYYCTATSVDCANYPGAPRQGFEVTGATTTLQQRPSPTQHVKRSDQLAKRVNKPVSYAQAICRADEIFAMLKSDDAQQSAFTNYNALAQTGYIFKITDPIDAALDPVFQGLSIDKHNFQGWSALYNPSDGTRQIQYTFYVNPQEGALVVEFAKGPINPLPANTPQRLSDIIFLVWQHYCSTATPAVEPGSLKYLIHRMVYNPSTQEILEQATANAGSKMQAWPGTPLDPTTDPGKAIVGSPNGYGVGFLMASHNTVFGDMTYQKITAFLDSYGDEGIVFEIGTASASKARRQAEEPNNGAQPGSGSRSTLSTIPVKTEAARVFPGTSAYNADFRGGLDDQPVWQYGIATTATGNDEW